MSSNSYDNFDFDCKPKNIPFSDLRMFKPAMLKKHKAVWPILGIIGVTFLAVPTFIAISLPRKTDVNFTKDRKRAPEEFVDVIHPKNQKLIKIKEEYEPLSEFNAALAYRKDYWKMQRKEDMEKIREKASKAILENKSKEEY